MELLKSHPTMGAWIEIAHDTVGITLSPRRTPRWVRGLKSIVIDKNNIIVCGSHPTMGAWIEIRPNTVLVKKHTASHPTMGAWIEIVANVSITDTGVASHPTMGAWIEIII